MVTIGRVEKRRREGSGVDHSICNDMKGRARYMLSRSNACARLFCGRVAAGLVEAGAGTVKLRGIYMRTIIVAGGTP